MIAVEDLRRGPLPECPLCAMAGSGGSYVQLRIAQYGQEPEHSVFISSVYTVESDRWVLAIYCDMHRIMLVPGSW